MRVLPLGGLRLQEIAERLAVLGRGLPPVALDRVPALTQPFVVGVPVLRDDRCDSLRVTHRKAEADRCANHLLAGLGTQRLQGLSCPSGPSPAAARSPP